MSQPESSSELSLGDGPIRIVRSDKNPLPWQSETTYEYLGLRFFLPEEFQAGIEDGSLYLQREALYNSDDKTRISFIMPISISSISRRTVRIWNMPWTGMPGWIPPSASEP